MQLVIDVCFSSTTPQVSARTAEEAILVQSSQVKSSQVKSSMGVCCLHTEGANNQISEYQNYVFLRAS